MSGGLATAISTHMRAVTEPMQSWTWRDNFAGRNAVRQNHPASALLLVTSSNITPACFLCGHACAMSLLCAHMHSLTSLIPCLPCPPPSVNTKTLVLAETAFPPWQLLTMSTTPHAGCQTNPVQGWQQPGHTRSALHPKPEHGSVGSILTRTPAREASASTSLMCTNWRGLSAAAAKAIRSNAVRRVCRLEDTNTSTCPTFPSTRITRFAVSNRGQQVHPARDRPQAGQTKEDAKQAVQVNCVLKLCRYTTSVAA